VAYRNVRDKTVHMRTSVTVKTEAKKEKESFAQDNKKEI